MRVRGWGLAKTNVPWGWSGTEGAWKRTRANKGGVGVKTRESWANILFQCPLSCWSRAFCDVARPMTLLNHKSPTSLWTSWKAPWSWEPQTVPQIWVQSWYGFQFLYLWSGKFPIVYLSREHWYSNLETEWEMRPSTARTSFRNRNFKITARSEQSCTV